MNFFLFISLFLTHGSFIDTWKVGDTTNYNVTQNFVPGKVIQKVVSKTEDEAWLRQELTILSNKQVMETLVGSNGEIKKVIVNGRERKLPDQTQIEVIKTEESQITVPAGTFSAVYTEVLYKKTNQISKGWLNPKAVPTGGLIKGIQPSQNGNITIELTSFVKK